MAEADPLRSLLLDAGELDRARIATALRPYVGIDEKSGGVFPLPEYGELKAREKILAVLLATKVAHLLGVADTEAVSNRDLAPGTGLPPGTAAPTLKELREGRLVSQTRSGEYYLSAHQVTRAVEALGGVNNRPTRPAAPSGRRTRQSTKAGSVPPEPAETEQKPRDTRVRRSDGPRAWVTGLVDEGFFDIPRGLKDIETELQAKQARTVPNTTLSPVLTRLLRQGVVTREKGPTGRWVYSRAQ